MSDVDTATADAPAADDSLTLAEAVATYRGSPEKPKEEETPDVPSRGPLTLEQSAEAISTAANEHREQHEAEAQAADASYIDSLRAKAVESNPSIAEEFGIELPAAEPTAERSAVEERAPIQNDYGLDAEVAKALELPQVKQALTEKLDAIEGDRKSYQAALSAATDVALASLTEQFPELGGIPHDQWPGAVAAIAQRDPSQIQRINGMLTRIAGLQTQQRQESERQQQAQRRQFEDYAKDQDAKFAKRIANESPEKLAQIREEIFAYANEFGISREQLLNSYQTDPTMRNAAFGAMMVDAAKYRMIQKTKVMPTRAVPPVQRPGVSLSGAERTAAANNARLSALNAKVERDPSIKNLANLLTEHRRLRG